MSERSRRSCETAGDRAGVSMTLWARQPVCGTRTIVIDRLHGVESDGGIGGFEVRTWPDSVRTTGDTPIESVVEEFESWADERGLSIFPPFERKTVSPLVGPDREEIVLPVMTLAVYDGDTLCGVYPCSDGERTWHVLDYLDACDRTGGAPRPADRPGLPP